MSGAMKIEVTPKGHAWAVTVNEDGTEGRGRQLVTAVCEIKETALRMAKGADVQGTDGKVERASLFLIEDGPSFSRLYGPVHLTQPSVDDAVLQRRNAKCEKAAQRFDESIQRARNLGLSDDDIAVLQGGVSKTG